MRIIFLTLSFLYIVQEAKAQTAEFNFINFSGKDGLSSNMVNAIFKDRYGYMWFGTEDGLNKFDGVHFKVYKHNSLDSTTLSGSIINTVHEDKAGKLWIGTNQGLSLYNPRKDAFINYDIANGGSVRAVCTDHLGNLWIGGYSGLYTFNPYTQVKKHYSKSLNAGQLKSNTVISVFEDSRRRLWIGTTAGLHLFIREDESFINYQHSSADSMSIANNDVRSITEDLEGNIWLATNGGLSKLLPYEKGFVNYRHSNQINSINNNRIDIIAVNNSGKLWVGTEAGLNLFDPSLATATRFSSDPRNKYSFTGKAVRSIYLDKNGIAWFGTNNSGVNKYDQNLAFFNLRQSNPLDPFGLSSSIITSFAENTQGEIYIGTDGGGLNLFNRKKGFFIRKNFVGIKEKEPLSILSMEKVGNELWIGTYQQGLFILNMVTGAIRHLNKGDGQKNISGKDVFCLKKDSRGNVWIGLNGEGVNFFDSVSGVLHRMNKNETSPKNQLLLNGFIRTIEEDKAGNIWIGSHGSGIAVYNPRTGSFRILNKVNSNLSTNNVLNIYIDSKDDVWVGTSGGGLCLYEKRTGKFIVYSEEQGLANGVIYKILEDGYGKLWLSTNSGLSSFDKKSTTFKNYSSQNGLQASAFNLGAGIKTSEGDLFFGGNEGFNYFNPKSLYINKTVPSLVFTDLKISNRSIVPGEDAAITEDISMAKEIRLDFKQNFSIDFSALNFTSPQDNRYSYKLNGFDKDWNHTGRAHTAVYTNLDPGEYTLLVKARSDDGLWSTPERSIKIFVKPPFWRTTYAYVFYILAICSLIGLMRYRGISKLKNKFALEQERLNAKQLIEQERREAERQHEFDQLRIKFLTNLSHEFRTPISLIVAPVEKMLQQEANYEKQQQLNLVQRNARRLLNMVNQLLDFRKLEEHESKLNLTQGDIVSFIREVAESFKEMSEHRNIHFSFVNSLDSFYTSFDKDKIERILFNLLSNAFKFTARDGEIYLQVEKKGESNLQITISDTGIGMTRDVQRKIFDPFFQGSSKAGILNQGTGIGLSITQEFVKLHGGSITVESEPGKGSVFTILLPCVSIFNDAANVSSIISGKVDALAAVGEEMEGFEKLTVLIVEDNDDFRNYLKDNLKAHYKIVEATNGKEGWQKALSAHPKLIVSDISMPVMDGITLSRKLKSDKRTSHIPIILLTALTGNTNQLLGLRTGASDYLTKPFSFEILDLKIKNLLELNQTLKETYTKQIKILSPEIKVQSEDEKLLVKISEYIESNLDSPDLSVEDLSKHVFMTRASLYNKVMSLTGETPIELIKSVKLKKAAALLENTDMKIGEIGYAVGFTSPNYFARAFKAKFDISPSEYLRLKRGAGGMDKQSQEIHS